MSITIKCWEVSEGTEPRALEPGGPQLEEHLEVWLERDISMLSTDLLVVGRQVEFIDLLAIDSEGRLVAIELKRDQVPREAIAQAVDYASRVSGWSGGEVVRIAEDYLAGADWIRSETLEDAFASHFGKSLEDVSLNNAQRIILAGARMEPGVERMVEWLSENGVDINVALFTFHHLGDDRWILARTFALSEEVTAARSAAKTGRRPPMTPDEYDDMVQRLGLEHHVQGLAALVDHPAFRKVWGLAGPDLEVEIPRDDGRPLRRKTVQVLAAASKPGVLRIAVNTSNLALRVEMSPDEVEQSLEAFERDPATNWRYEVEAESPAEVQALASAILSLFESGSANEPDFSE